MGIETEIEQEVAGLLKEKARLFICFESVTEQMMTDSPEDIDRMIECVSKRESLKEQIDDRSFVYRTEIREAGPAGEGGTEGFPYPCRCGACERGVCKTQSVFLPI